ncbi:MAG: carbon-nitrogen hydrolase family protein, partial [Acidobacteria bacterium]
MIIALASPRIATSVNEGLEKVKRLMVEASERGAEIVCFPEAYLPGLRGLWFKVPDFSKNEEQSALREVSDCAKTYRIATILGMEKHTEAGLQIVACVIDARGE